MAAARSKAQRFRGGVARASAQVDQADTLLLKHRKARQIAKLARRGRVEKILAYLILVHD